MKVDETHRQDRSAVRWSTGKSLSSLLDRMEFRMTAICGKRGDTSLFIHGNIVFAVFFDNILALMLEFRALRCPS